MFKHINFHKLEALQKLNHNEMSLIYSILFTAFHSDIFRVSTTANNSRWTSVTVSNTFI